jgi:DnaJ-class molecular chaperone
MDPYKVLGIGPGASKEEIKRAYRKQATKLHPDKGGTSEAFAQLHDSYEYLKKINEGRYSIPIQGQYEKIQVRIPLEKLVQSSRHDIDFNGKIYEIELPNWQPEWLYEHVFTVDQYRLKIQVQAQINNYFINNGKLCKEIKINQLESMVGAEVRITENLAVKVPPGTVTSTEISVSNLGFIQNDYRADMSCIFVIKPVQLSNSDMELPLKELIKKYTSK